MLRLAIIADDLTGALDAAAPFAGVPGGVVVATRSEALGEALARNAGVVAVSTRSREIGADEARLGVARVLDALPPEVRRFKKVDSRLKGNVAAELAPFGVRRLLVAPAIPEFGRIVRGGALQGFGVDDPIAIAPLLGPAARHADVPDTEAPADMLAALDRAGDDAVLVGARGLATALAARLGVAVGRRAVLPRPICIAVGSTDPITLGQVARLRQALPGLGYRAAPSGVLSARPGAMTATVTLLQMTPGEAAGAAGEAARRFAEGASPWLRAARTMLLTGGATAEACLDALGIEVLSIRGEVLPGLPVSDAGEWAVVTKSGGFGTPDTLLRLTGYPAAAEA